MEENKDPDFCYCNCPCCIYRVDCSASCPDSGSQGREIVVRFVYITNNQVSNIEINDELDW